MINPEKHYYNFFIFKSSLNSIYNFKVKSNIYLNVESWWGMEIAIQS